MKGRPLMIGTAWAADAARAGERLLLRSGVLGRGRLRHLLRARRQDSVGPHLRGSTSAPRTSPSRWPTPSACATRRSRPRQDAERTLGQATAEGDASCQQAREEVKRMQARAAARPGDRRGAARAAGAGSHRPGRGRRHQGCARHRCRRRPFGHPRAAARAGRLGPSAAQVDEAIAELPRRMH